MNRKAPMTAEDLKPGEAIEVLLYFIRMNNSGRRLFFDLAMVLRDNGRDQELLESCITRLRARTSVILIPINLLVDRLMARTRLSSFTAP